MGALAFVTQELSPFSPGGIGRVVHNLLKSMSVEDRRRAWVVAVDCELCKAAFEAVFPDVRLLQVDSRSEDGRYVGRGHQPPQRAFTDSVWHWKSSVVFRALQQLCRTVEIDYVEFPDFGALGFAAVQEKKINGFLSSATLAVRLHSTHAILLHHEAYAVGDTDRCLVDLERKTLRDCDLIIAQLSAVGEHTRQTFGFKHDEWDARLVRHAPPVLLDTRRSTSATIAADPAMPIMFGSKLQAFKRPDIFIRGASAYCRANPHYTGDLVISAHSFDKSFGDYILQLAPPDLAARFHTDAPRHSAAREPLIATSTFVVPSDFESFCLAAYEASLLGARVILNGSNPGFGDDTPWQDGVNCYKFDGSALGLQKALERSFSDESVLRPVEALTDPWPWNAQVAPVEFAVTDGHPLVSVIIPHFNLGKYLPSTLASALEQTYDTIEIIIVDDCSTDEASRALIENLQLRQRAGLKIVSSPGNIGLAAARNLALEHATGEYIMPLDADDLIDRRFAEVAVRALQRNPDFDVFVTPAGYFNDGDTVVLPGEEADFPDYAVFVGEALVSGFKQNRFSTATCVVRADVLRKYRYTESLRCYEDWNLYVRLTQAGHRFLVANDVYFHYRNRANSMVKLSNDVRQHAIFLHDMLRTATNRGRSVPLAYLAFCDSPDSAKSDTAASAPAISAGPFLAANANNVFRLLLSAAPLQIFVIKIKQLILYPSRAARRRYRAKLREWRALRKEVRLQLK